VVLLRWGSGMKAQSTAEDKGMGVPTPTLDRRFEALIFDWDGTAVPDRVTSLVLISIATAWKRYPSRSTMCARPTTRPTIARQARAETTPAAGGRLGVEVGLGVSGDGGADSSANRSIRVTVPS
jgi:hypothetical protein